MQLVRWVRQHGPQAALEKLRRLEQLEHEDLPTARRVLELHEAACYLRAYPDSVSVLACAERILESFAERRDLQRHKDELVSTGIAGTDMHFAYFWFTAYRLVRRWPRLLTVDWSEFEHASALEELLPLLLNDHEALVVEEGELELPELIAAIKGRSETDAAFLVQAFRSLQADPLLREKLFDDLVLPLVLEAGPGTPSRTHAAFPVRHVAFQEAPLVRAGRPHKRAYQEEPVRVRHASRAEGEQLVWLAQEAMMTRKRDLYAFIHADPNDVLLVGFEGGLQFACIGIEPERRHLLYAMYVVLALKNGVPVGYVQATTLFESAEINFNVFDTFRSAEAARIFTTSLAMVHHVFQATTFAINTQQLGVDNPEALTTGAWWFYHKHGFRPDGAETRRLAESELAARKRDPSRRSSVGTLRKLGSEPLFLSLGPRRSDAIGRLNISHIGIQISRRLSALMDCDSGKLERRCRTEAMALMGIRDASSWSRDERRALDRWAPLVLALPGVEGWPAADRRALAPVVRAKAARREVDYVALFDQHGALRQAVRRLARSRSRP